MFLTVLMVLATVTIAYGKEKNEKVKVKGNCGMCEAKIEKAAKSVDGVSLANWDKKAKILEVTFDDSKTNLEQIELAITGVGYDTEHHKASNETYSSLPACCKYDREVK